jgi:hypothetical protein
VDLSVSTRLAANLPAVLHKAGGVGLTTSQNASSDAWRKSSISGANNECVEVRFNDGSVSIRHSKEPGGHILTVSERAWRALLDGIKKKELPPGEARSRIRAL